MSYATHNFQPVMNDTVVKWNRFSSDESFTYHISLDNWKYNVEECKDIIPHLDWFASPSDCDYNTYYPDGSTYFEETYPFVWSKKYNLAGWQAATGLDMHSSIEDISLPDPTCPEGIITSTCLCGGIEYSNGYCCSGTWQSSPCLIEQELIAHWKLDETSGFTAYDSSGNGNTGTLVNGPTWTAGKIDGGLSFDGIDDNVNFGTPSDLLMSSNTIFSISLWLKINSKIPGQFPILAGTRTSTRGYWFELNPSSNMLYFITRDNSFHKAGISYSEISDKNWYFVTGVFGGTGADQQKIYLDGVLKNSTEGSYNAPTSNFYIGYNQNDNDYFNGSIDDVRIYNRALNSTEILQLYNQGMTDCGDADSNTDGSVSITELINYITQWKSGEITITELIAGIGEWKNGC